MDHICKAQCVDERTVLVYYFFDFADEMSLNPTTVLNYLIKQLMQKQLAAIENISRDIRTSLEETYGKGMSTARKFDLKILSGHLQDLCGLFGRVFIIIDGLDECKRSDRGRLIAVLKSFLVSNISTSFEVKLLLASRPEIDIKEQLELSTINFHSIILSDEKEDHHFDMRLYITSRLKVCFNDLGLLPSHEDILEDVSNALLTEADGM